MYVCIYVFIYFHMYICTYIHINCRDLEGVGLGSLQLDGLACLVPRRAYFRIVGRASSARTVYCVCGSSPKIPSPSTRFHQVLTVVLKEEAS